MKLSLWIIYCFTKVCPLKFLLASGKALGWEVSYVRSGEFVKSIEFTNPNIEEEVKP